MNFRPESIEQWTLITCRLGYASKFPAIRGIQKSETNAQANKSCNWIQEKRREFTVEFHKQLHASIIIKHPNESIERRNTEKCGTANALGLFQRRHTRAIIHSFA